MRVDCGIHCIRMTSLRNILDVVTFGSLGGLFFYISFPKQLFTLHFKGPLLPALRNALELLTCAWHSLILLRYLNK